METVALLYEDYQKELAEDFKNTFLKRASDTDSSRSNDTVIDEVTDMLSTNIAVYTEKLLQRWGFSSGGEGGGGGDVTVTLDDLLKKYLSDNYVTIKGDQEVFGEKDFRKGIRIAGRRLYWDEGNDALVIEGAAYTTRWLSAKGVSPGGGGAGSGGAAAMYQLIDVSPNDTKDAVLGAEKDYVLTFDGSFWRGMPNKGGLSSKLFTALDKEGHEINPDDENAEIYAIRANYSLWSVGFLSAKGISDGGTGGGGGGGAVALYQLLDVEKNADITGVAGATKGSVLTFNGDKWYADKPKTAAGISNLFTALDNDGNEVDLNDESKLGTITNIRANYALWSVDWISAKGKSSGGSGGGGGLINLVYGFESLGGTFDNNDNSATFNAFTINEIWKLASSGLTNVTVTGSGNAVTDVIKGSDGRSLTFTKGSTFATKSEFDALNTKFNDFLTGSDADDIINKWSELEVFLQGMKESDNLAVILQSKMDKTAFSKLFTALDASGNEVDPSDDTKTIASIRANFGFWGVDYISAKGVSKGSGGTGGASTLYQLVDVLANDTEDGVEGAAAGKALVFDGTHWRAGDAGLNESQLYSYLTANKYLTQSAADSRYVTSSRKVIAGTGLSGGGALTSDVTLSLGTSGVVAGTYTKVMVDAYGRVTSGTNLSATDIPNLDWSKITTGKPTTLAGYGITDAYTKTEADGKYVTIATPQTITGQKTFTKNIAMNSGIGLSYSGNTVFRNTSGNTVISSYGDSGMLYFRPNGDTSDVGVVQINKQGHINGVSAGFKGGVSAARLSATEYVQIGDAYLKWDAANNAVYVIKKDGTTPVGFYSTDWLSAKGVSMSGAQTGTLDSLNDVEITDPVNGQALKYDAASKKWVNGTIDSFNVNQMWAELKKADSSKVIDASHIPTSVLDGRWVKKAGDTMTGTLTSASSSGSIVFKGVENCDITNIYKDNGVIKNADDGYTSIRNGLRFNWYDTYWYIGNLRGSSTDSAGFGVVDHNNKLVLRVTPNDVRAPRFMSTVATGLSPLIVSSNTLVNNLNADLLDGYHQSKFLRTDGVNQHITLTGGDRNTEGYRLVLEATVTGGWSVNSMTLLVNSRHAGTGMISIVFHTMNQESTSYIGSLNYYGSTISLGDTMWRLFYNTTTKKVRLFWHFYDYSDCQVSILNRRGITTNISNKTWYTTIPSDSGSELPAYYNWASSAYALATSRTLWGQPFNGTANVSGNMTGVGSINMSGVLTIKNSTYNKQLIIWSAGSTAKNQGEGIWFRCGDATQEVVLRHEWYDSFVPGYGLAVSKHDSLEAGDANMFFYNTGRFIAKAPQGTSPYQCVSTTLNTNLNADLLDNWHIMDIPRNYNSTATYSLQFALGSTDNNWKKIFACSESGAGPYRSVTVWGRIWYAYGNHAQDEVRSYHFCAIFQMRSGPSASDSNVGDISNSARLYLPTFAKGMDNIRLVRVGTNNFELQVRQIGSYNNGYIQYQYWANGANVSAWRGLQFTSNTSVAVSAGGASTLADSRASSADVWTTARTFYIQDYHSANTGAGVSVNGGSNCYLKLPSTTRFSRIDFSTPNANIRHSGNDNGNEVGSSTLSNLVIDSWYGVSFTTTCSSTYQNKIAMSVNCRTGRVTANNFHAATNITANGAITAKASSSDIRLKTDIQGYDAMGIIRKFRSVKYHWNAIAKENSEVFNHDNWNYGLIAQDLLSGGYSQWVKDAFNDYYTIDYERLIPVVWKGLQEVDDEVTKLKREVARLNKRVKELEKSLCA